jgi:sporulation protein YlmC with PRC-barrel domain
MRSAEMIDFIYDHNGHNIGWLQNGQVFTNADKMIGTVRDGQLYTLDGEATGLFLGNVGVRSTAETQAKLKRLFEGSPS